MDSGEQIEVLSWLVTRLGMTAELEPLANAAGFTVLRERADRGQLGREPRDVAAAREISARMSLGEVRVVPVRFPVPQYERLKAWSTDSGFPIAAIVRGLVERFLDSQTPPPS